MLTATRPGRKRNAPHPPESAQPVGFAARLRPCSNGPVLRAPRLSLILRAHGTDGSRLVAAARAASKLDLAGLWVPDNLMNQSAPRSGVLECWTALSAIADAAGPLAIGPLVLTTPFRRLALLAKQIATLDSLAPGRVRVGLGSGGFTYEDACAQFGFERLSTADRVRHVEETVVGLRTLLTDDPATFEGRFDRARDLRIHPRPETPPPFVVAARRPGMIAATARVADGWNCPLPHELAEGLTALEAAGRSRDSIDVSVFAIGVVGLHERDAAEALDRAGPTAQLFGDVRSHHVFGGVDAVVDKLHALAAAGADEVTLDPRGLPFDEIVALLAEEVLPRLGERRP